MIAFVDSDILYDVLTGRTPHVTNSEAVLNWCEQHPGQSFFAWHSMANAAYIFRRNPGIAAVRSFFHDLLAFAQVAPTATAEAKHARSLPMTDLEDAMQAAAAVAASADYIVTRNIRHYVNSPIPAILPSDFLNLV
jgi:predicted nucleic acid-binding protein